MTYMLSQDSDIVTNVYPMMNSYLTQEEILSMKNRGTEDPNLQLTEHGVMLVFVKLSKSVPIVCFSTP